MVTQSLESLGMGRNGRPRSLFTPLLPSMESHCRGWVSAALLSTRAARVGRIPRNPETNGRVLPPVGLPRGGHPIEAGAMLPPGESHPHE
jgi:hypothetical protein